MRQGHEIGKSIRTGNEDKQFKVHSMSALLLTLILRGMLLTYTIRAPGSEMSTTRQQSNLGVSGCGPDGILLCSARFSEKGLG